MKTPGVLIIGIVALIVGFFIFRGITGTVVLDDGANYDNFAKCLTEKGAKMYGAYWCPHCQNQKKLFGESWKYVDYVECSLPNGAGQTSECQIAGISGYPTWVFSDGRKVPGEVSFQQLSQITGCSLQ